MYVSRYIYKQNKISVTVYFVPSSMILAAADMPEFNISSQSIRGVNAVAVTTSTSDNNSPSLLLRFSRAFSSSHLKCSFRQFLDCSALNFTLIIYFLICSQYINHSINTYSFVES